MRIIINFMASLLLVLMILLIIIFSPFILLFSIVHFMIKDGDYIVDEIKCHFGPQEPGGGLIE